MIQPTVPNGFSLTDDDCIQILENLKKRTRFYDSQFGYMGDDYCELLAGIESLALDTAISALKDRGRPIDRQVAHSPPGTSG